MRSKVNILNRKVKYEYFILSSFNAGIMLTGSEIKSIRNNDANISDCYCLINEKGLAKIEISIVKGKKLYDKRNSIKDRDNKIKLDKLKKNFNA